MKVTCTRPNASELINGIPFVRQDDGSVVASGVSAEDAAVFIDFDGYKVEAEDSKPTKVAAVSLVDAVVSPAEELVVDTKPAKTKK